MNRSWHIIGNGIEYESSCASGKSAITQTMIPTIEETCLEKSPLWVNVHDFFLCRRLVAQLEQHAGAALQESTSFRVCIFSVDEMRYIAALCTAGFKLTGISG